VRNLFWGGCLRLYGIHMGQISTLWRYVNLCGQEAGSAPQPICEAFLRRELLEASRGDGMRHL
jgi:hypothetical protein